MGPRWFGKRSGQNDKVYGAAFFALVWIGVLGFLPIGIAMVVGLIQDTIAEDVFTPSPGYPAFSVLSPGLVVPAALLTFVFVRTFTWPLKDPAAISRSDLAWMSFMGMGVTMAGIALEGGSLPTWAGRFDFIVAALFLCVWALAYLRIAAGWLRLVPRSWREEPVKPKRRRRS